MVPIAIFHPLLCNLERVLRVRVSMDWKDTLCEDLESSWLYRALWVGALLLGYISAYAQPDLPEGYTLQVEEVASHSDGELAGMTTYRLYVNCRNAEDYVSSCSGDNDNPLIIASTASPAWYNSGFNTSWNAQGVNPMLFLVLPELAYDSYITIGAEDATSSNAEHPSSIWGEIDVTLEFDGDGPGNSVLVDDSLGGAWYTVFPGLDEADNHAGFAGDDLRVLVAQLTTAGEVSGQIQVQIFQNGLQAQEIRETLPILTNLVPGCLDANATNYNPEANVSDSSSCLYPCGTGTRYFASTGMCELAAWQGEVGDTQTLDPCHLDLDASGWMDITDLFAIHVVQGLNPDTPAAPCGAGTQWDAALQRCVASPSTLGEGNGLNNLNPRYFDLNGDGELNTTDFLNVLNVFGSPCLD